MYFQLHEREREREDLVLVLALVVDAKTLKFVNKAYMTCLKKRFRARVHKKATQSFLAYVPY